MKKNMLKILVIDDDPDIHKFIEAVIPKKGFQVFRAQNSNTGTIASLNFEPDLIILDMQMPGGSGALVHEAVSRRFNLSKMPILIFSSLSPQEVRGMIQITAQTSFLQKPAQPEMLRQAVFKLLEAHN